MTAVREEWILSQLLSSILRKKIGRARERTSDLLFSSPQCYLLGYGARPHSTQETLWNYCYRYVVHSFYWLFWHSMDWKIPSFESLNPLPDSKILNRSKLKQSADNNFKFDENSRKFSNRVENTGGKGEIAPYEQFLLFPQCFEKAFFPGASKGVIVWEWVNMQSAFHYTIPTKWHFLMPLGNKPFENTVGKAEIAGNECFLPVWITFCHFRQIWNCCLQSLSIRKSLKFVIW